MRQPVRFIQSIQVAHQLGARVFLEMGPDAQLVACGQREYRDNAYWIASARRNKEASDVLNQALLQLYAAASPYRGPTCWRAMDNVSLRHVIRLILNVTGKSASPGLRACRRSAVCRAGGGESRRDSARSPRLEALKQCATRLHAIYVDQLVQRCTAMPLRTAWTP